MTKLKNNVIVRGGVSGMFGDQVVFREVAGRVIMSNRPKRGRVLTPHQEATKSRFKQAVMYAKAQVAIPANKAEYATGINDKLTSAYAVAMTDYLKAPKINLIDVSLYKGVIGDKIAINAVDDFKVASVTVVIKSAAGVVIESGAATLDAGKAEDFSYGVTKANAAFVGSKVSVTVKDKPGNATVLEKVV
jgi:hypothetical protein